MGAFSFLLIPTLLAAGPSVTAGTPPTIDWPDFFAHVFVEGVEYGGRVRQLEGMRVRLRGYSIPMPRSPRSLLLSREPFPVSEAEETEIPFDAVGVLWREGIPLPPIPTRPTVEGTLRLGNRGIGDQIVTITVEDAVPVYPAKRLRVAGAVSPLRKTR